MEYLTKSKKIVVLQNPIRSNSTNIQNVVLVLFHSPALIYDVAFEWGPA